MAASQYYQVMITPFGQVVAGLKPTLDSYMTIAIRGKEPLGPKLPDKPWERDAA